MKKKLLYFILPIITLLAGAAGMYVLITYLPFDLNKESTFIKKQVTISDNGIAESVDKVIDAVVVVETFKNNKLYASGTGFVYKKDQKSAYILTNNHVVSGADKVKIIFTNKKEYEATITGNDAYSDIAVLSIDVKNIVSVAEMGKSKEARIGDTVFTVGAPLDNVYSWSVTRGIVSGKDRLVEISTSNTNTNVADYVMSVIQTDAAINSGNSGGPLVNANGQVLGITSLKLVSSGVEAMGFAIPIENALSYAETLEKGHQIVRPYLGVSMYDASYMGSVVGAVETEGVVINAVEEKSSADKGGLQKGDIVIKIDEDQVSSVAFLKYHLYQHKVGDKIKLTIKRDNKEKVLNIELKANTI